MSQAETTNTAKEEKASKPEVKASGGIKGLGGASNKLKSSLSTMDKMKAKKQLAMQKPATATDAAPAITKKVISKPEKKAIVKPQMQEKKKPAKKAGPTAGSSKSTKPETPNEPTLRRSKRKITPKQKVTADFCAICYRVQLENTQHPDNPLLRCQGSCLLKAHKRCLGQSVCEIDASAKSFKCTGCSEGKKASCVVCLIEGEGLMTKVTNKEDQMIHYVCALFCDTYEIVDVAAMSIQESDKPAQAQSSLEENKDLQCDICAKSGGFFLQCLKLKCKKQVHPFCLQQELCQTKLKEAVAENEDPDTQDSAMADESQEDHTETEKEAWDFECKLQDYTLYQSKRSLHSELNESMLTNLEYFEEYHGREGIQQLLTPEGTPSKQQSFRAKITQNKRPSRYNLPQRGGKVNVVCDEHRNEFFYCCENKALDSQSMLLCEFCLNWYHLKCEQVSGKDMDAIQNFECSNCKDWGAKYEQVFKPVIDIGKSEDMLVPGSETEDFSSWQSWKRQLFPLRSSFGMATDEIILIANVWQKQVESILESDKVANIDLIRQQVLLAQFIPINLQSGVTKLNALLDKVISHEKSKEESEKFVLSEVMSSDGMIDEEKLKANQEVAQKAQAQVSQESKALKVLTYKMMEVQTDVVEQVSAIEKCLAVVRDEKVFSLDQIEELIDDLDQDMQPNLHNKVTEKFKSVKQWIEKVSKINKGTNEPQSKQKRPPKKEVKAPVQPANIDEANELISQGTELSKIVDLSLQLTQLQASVKSAQDWDEIFTAQQKGDKKDFQEFINLLIQAQSATIRTQLMVTQLTETDTNELWLSQSQRFFKNEMRDQLREINLTETIKTVESVKNNTLATQICSFLKETQTSCSTNSSKIETWSAGTDQIESIEQLEEFMTNELGKLPITLENEAKLKFIVDCLKWSNGEAINVDLIEAKALTLKLSDQLKEKHDKKLKDVDQDYQDKIESKLAELKEEKTNVTLAQLKQTASSIKSIVKAKESIEKEHSVTIKSVQSNLVSLSSWLERCNSALNKAATGKTSAQKGEVRIDSLLSTLQKQVLSSLFHNGEQTCKGALAECSLAKLLHSMLQDSLSSLEIKSALDSTKSLKQLQQLLTKAQKGANEEQTSILSKQIESVEAWYKDLSEIKMSDADLRKKLAEGPESQNDVKAKLEKLLAKQSELKLKIEDGEHRYIRKLKQWLQLVADCQELLKTEQSSVSIDRMYEIEDLLKRETKLSEIPEAQKTWEEFKNVQKWDDIIQAFGSASPVNLGVMKNEIEKAIAEVTPNFQTTFKSYLNQVDVCLKWVAEAETYLKDQSKSDLGKMLIEQLADDQKTEDDLSLVDQTLILKVKVQSFKDLFKIPADPKLKTNTSQFLKTLSKHKIADYGLAQDQVTNEMDIIKLAKKLDQFESKASELEVTQSESESLLEADNSSKLPFKVPSKAKDFIQAEFEKFKSLQTEADALLNADDKPKIDQITPLLEKLKKISIRSDLEQNLQEMIDNHSYVVDQWSKICQLTNLKEDDKAMQEEEAFEYSELKRSVQIYKANKFVCEEASKLSEWYEEQKAKFEHVRGQVDQFKAQGNLISYKLNRELQDQLSKFVDFGHQEQSLLQDLWHSTVELMIKSLPNKQQEGEEASSCDGPKYWLEEAQQLQISESDPKISHLNDLIEDLDDVNRVARQCNDIDQLEQVLSYANEVIAPRLSFKRHLIEFKERGTKNAAGLTGKNSKMTPLEYLKSQVAKRKKIREAQQHGSQDDDAVMDGAAQDDQDDDEESDDGCEAEKDNEDTKAVKDKKAVVKSTSKPKPKSEIAKKRETKAVTKTEKKVVKAAQTKKTKPKEEEKKTSETSPKQQITKKPPLFKKKETSDANATAGGGLKMGGAGIKAKLNTLAKKKLVKASADKTDAQKDAAKKEDVKKDADSKTEAKKDESIPKEKEQQGETEAESPNKASKPIIGLKRKAVGGALGGGSGGGIKGLGGSSKLNGDMKKRLFS